ncbi:MAG: glycosyltransferase family 2 protein [Alloprevotella sp.]|nr:glycosyltransferase family 2 protein [Alloprevotella sp.]
MGKECAKAGLVSVIIPVYNQERYIRKCLDSVCGQSYRDLEIIVVDDGSTDNSLPIAERVAARDPRVRIIKKRNEGLAFARRDGLSAASGGFIMHVDSDDYILPDAVENLLRAYGEHGGPDIVYGGFKRRYSFLYSKMSGGAAAGVPRGRLISQPELFGKYYVSFFGWNLLRTSQWGALFRKEALDRAMGEEALFDPNFVNYGEDTYFNLLLFPYLRSVCVIDTPVYVYRYGGITCRYNAAFKTYLDFSDIRLGLLDKYNYELGYKFLYAEYRNLLLTEIVQRMQYGHESERPKLYRWLDDELHSRKVAARVAESYAGKTDLPHWLSAIANRDINALLDDAEKRVRAQRWRFRLKRLAAKLPRGW